MNSKFEFIETDFSEAFLIKPFYASDDRGGFLKDYNVDVFSNNNVNLNLKEVFYTISKKGVIRAIHFQNVKEQAKLVRCIKGKVYDVIVDLRKDSKTFGKWQGFELSESNMMSIYVPRGFGHGYLVLEDSVVSYKCDEVFYGEYDSGIMWNDKDINIKWPLEKILGESNLIISEKDKKLQSLKEYKKYIESI